MKPYVRGKSIFLREVSIEDAEFIVNLRNDPVKSKYISYTSSDINNQKEFIINYNKSINDFYFIICDWKFNPLGTIRIYDIIDESFCWGSWIISDNAPLNTAIESALLIYDFGFYALHYSSSHFDVKKENKRVLQFHQRFGAIIVGEDDLNYYFNYTRDNYLEARKKYQKFLR